MTGWGSNPGKLASKSKETTFDNRRLLHFWQNEGYYSLQVTAVLQTQRYSEIQGGSGVWHTKLKLFSASALHLSELIHSPPTSTPSLPNQIIVFKYWEGIFLLLYHSQCNDYRHDSHLHYWHFFRYYLHFLTVDNQQNKKPSSDLQYFLFTYL